MAKQKKIDFKNAEASAAYEKMKKDFSRIFKSYIRKGMTPVEAAKEAGKTYRQAYGSTPTKRWAKARKEGDKLKLIGLGTFSVAK